MSKLGRVLVEALVHHYGTDEVLRRLSHPFWFQSLGAFMGMDWHSSGITTSVIGTLKRGLAPIEDEIGLRVCGGRGKHSRKTPAELDETGQRWGVDGDVLSRVSRLVAKVDGNAVQDGFQLYLHGFIVSKSGQWTVVQQGMSGQRREARRYHWLSEGLDSFIDAPHKAIDGRNRGAIINLTDAHAAANRQGQLDLVGQGPDAVLGVLSRPSVQGSLFQRGPHLSMPAHHDVLPEDIVPRRLGATLAAAADRGPEDFPELLLLPGVGPRTVRALAMAAELVHGAPCRFTDPARFSLAHGGKDGHPFPVPLKVYDQTIGVLKDAVHRARGLGQADRLAAIEKLDKHARAAQSSAPAVDAAAFMEKERQVSHALGGRTVFGWAGPPDSGADSSPGSESDSHSVSTG
jgi:hypothetical protein